MTMCKFYNGFLNHFQTFIHHLISHIRVRNKTRRAESIVHHTSIIAVRNSGRMTVLRAGGVWNDEKRGKGSLE